MTWAAFLSGGQAAGRSDVPEPPRASSTASVPSLRTAGSGSTRTRWPESGHQPTTRPGTSSPCRRNASTRVTSASSARIEPRRGPDSTTRCAFADRTSARPRSASSAEWGLSHQWSRPTTGADRERRPVESTPEAGGPGHRFRTDGGPPGRRETVDPAVQLRGGGTALQHPVGGFGHPAAHRLEGGPHGAAEQHANWPPPRWIAAP